MKMMNVYVANLGKYNEGKLVGEWLTLPATNEEIEEIMVKIGVAHYDENGEFVPQKTEIENGIEYVYEEYAIHDYECDIEEIEIGEYSNLEKLNEIAEGLSEIDEYDLKCISALLELGYIDQKDILEKTIQDILDDYCFTELEEMGNTDMALGYAMVEGTDIERQLEELNISSYFDYESYGRDARYNGASVASNNIAIL